MAILHILVARTGVSDIVELAKGSVESAPATKDSNLRFSKPDVLFVIVPLVRDVSEWVACHDLVYGAAMPMNQHGPYRRVSWGYIPKVCSAFVFDDEAGLVSSDALA